MCSLVLEGKRLLLPLDVETNLGSTSVDDSSRGVHELPPRVVRPLLIPALILLRMVVVVVVVVYVLKHLRAVIAGVSSISSVFVLVDPGSSLGGVWEL